MTVETGINGDDSVKVVDARAQQEAIFAAAGTSAAGVKWEGKVINLPILLPQLLRLLHVL